MKLNDIHELIGTDTADVVLEVGRPGVSTTFRDVQTLCSTLADMGVRVDPGTPVAAVMEDLERWRLKPEVLGERALSVMIQFRVSNERLGSILGALRAVSAELDTVCSISVVNRIKAGGEAPAAIISADAGFPVRVHSKINLGLGARLPEEE